MFARRDGYELMKVRAAEQERVCDREGDVQGPDGGWTDGLDETTLEMPSDECHDVRAGVAW
jgi:hypothetical protein